MHQRAFVLRPLLDLAPTLVHPLLGRLDDRLPALADQALRKWR
jgi:2-amino-4-hydroxy-6-hydroxymethyldihydropteridine diphosphokinase